MTVAGSGRRRQPHGNSPPEGLFSRGGCHPCRVLAESEVVGEARCSRQDTWQPSSELSVGSAGPDNNGVASSPEIGSRCRPDRADRSAPFRFAPSRPVPARPGPSPRPVLPRTVPRRPDPSSRVPTRFRLGSRAIAPLIGEKSARARSIGRSIGPTNRRATGQTNERTERSSERASTRERTRQGEPKLVVVSFSFVRVSGGTVPRIREPIPFDGQV